MSPDLTATLMSGTSISSFSANDIISSKGCLRFLSISFARAFKGEIYIACTPSSKFPSLYFLKKSFRILRKAVRVFPEPVGLETRTFSLFLIRGTAIA